MSDIKSDIEKLLTLLKEKEAEDPAVDEAPQDASDDDKKPEIDIDPYQRPRSLEGLSWEQIVILECDGHLSRAEEEWLSRRSPPTRDGSIRFPSLKSILERSKYNGDGKIETCQICGEGTYLFDEEDVQICIKCGSIIFSYKEYDYTRSLTETRKPAKT